MASDIINNIKRIKQRIIEAEKQYGREEGSVKLMAVSKFHSVEEIQKAIANGVYLFGENRVQEAIAKFPELIQTFPHIKLHMIGSLQRNKVKVILPIVTCIESIDRIELLEEIDKYATKLQKKIEVLFEVHTGEESKSGFTSFEKLCEAIEYAKNSKFIVPKGFMTMAPFTEDEELIRESFKKLRQTAKDVKKKFPSLKLTEFSMGMSNDFEIAISEGSTIVRIGTSIFGERVYD